MNAIIEDLATRSGMVNYPTGLGISENTLWGDRNIENFAKLVVLHCCDHLMELERDYLIGSVVRNLKQEFEIL